MHRPHADDEDVAAVRRVDRALDPAEGQQPRLVTITGGISDEPSSTSWMRPVRVILARWAEVRRGTGRSLTRFPMCPARSEAPSSPSHGSAWPIAEDHPGLPHSGLKIAGRRV